MQSLTSICFGLRSGKKESLRSLCSLISSTDEERLPALFTVVHPHLRSVLFDNKRSDLVEMVYLSYIKFFKLAGPLVGSSAAVQVLDDLSSFLFLCSSARGCGDRPWAIFSEECCLAMSKCMEALFASLTTNSAIGTVYSATHLPLLSHICFTLLQMSESASSRAVRVHSLRCIRHFAKPRYDSVSSPLVATCIASLLPGSLQTFYRLITGDAKVGSVVLSTVLDSWSSVFECVFSQKHEPLSTVLATTDDPKSQLFSTAWYSYTCSRSHQLISRVVDHILHVGSGPSTDIGNDFSASFVNWLSCILLKCPALFEANSCSSIRDTVISALVAVAAYNDISESEAVANVDSTTRRSLNQFVHRSELVQASLLHVPLPREVVNGRLLRKITTTALIEHINSLVILAAPSVDEIQLQRRLRTILGFLRVLDSESLSILVCSRDLFHRLCASFAELLCFNTRSVELFDESPTHAVESACAQQLHGTHPPSLFRKSFEFFRDPRTLSLIQVVVGRLASQTHTFDLFMDTCRDLMFQTGTAYRNPALLLISAGLCGYLTNATVDWGQRKTDCLRVVSEYFESDLLQLQTSTGVRRTFVPGSTADLLSIQPLPAFGSNSHDHQSGENASLKESKENVLTVCLVIELFCVASQLYPLQPVTREALSSDVAEDLLRICLLPCASCASLSGLIGQTAKHCLHRVAANCAYSGVSELITKNADFLIPSITLDVHRIILFGPTDGLGVLPAHLLTALASVGQVLQTLFEYASFDMLPLLQPLVKQILACLDLTYEYHADLFLPALKRLLLTCRELDHIQNGMKSTLPASEHTFTNCEAPEAPEWFHLTFRNVRSVVADTRRLHHFPTRDEPPPGERRRSCAAPDDHDDTRRPYPVHLQITEEVMLRCVHLLTAETPKSRLLCMDVLIQGYLILSSERGLLLPLVHKVWASLMSRFRDQDAVVVEKAFELLMVLSGVAGDFLRSRASTDILPSLLSFLTRGANASAGTTDSYRFLTSYRIQRHLILELGSLCSRLELSSDTLRSTISLLLLYLEDSQPSGLQQASEHSLGVLWSIDAGLVWTLLLEQLPPDYVTSLFGVPPAPGLFPLEMKLPVEHNRLSINPNRLRDILGRLCSYMSIKTHDV